eukprot:442591-Rhodomonas_salina.1
MTNIVLLQCFLEGAGITGMSKPAMRSVRPRAGVRSGSLEQVRAWRSVCPPCVGSVPTNAVGERRVRSAPVAEMATAKSPVEPARMSRGSREEMQQFKSRVLVTDVDRKRPSASCRYRNRGLTGEQRAVHVAAARDWTGGRSFHPPSVVQKLLWIQYRKGLVLPYSGFP